MIEEELRPWVERHGWDPGVDAYARLAVLVDLWMRYGAAMNLHGARTRAELLRHVQDGLETVLCARRAIAVDERTQWLDVGSGGGFPALVVAATLPCRVVAVEPRQKRASFLELAFAAIERDSSRVIRARYGDRTWDEKLLNGIRSGEFGLFSIASARAVWAPAEWLELGKTLVTDPGIVVVHGAVASGITRGRDAGMPGIAAGHDAGTSGVGAGHGAGAAGFVEEREAAPAGITGGRGAVPSENGPRQDVAPPENGPGHGAAPSEKRPEHAEPPSENGPGSVPPEPCVRIEGTFGPIVAYCST